MTEIKITTSVHFGVGQRSRKELRTDPPPAAIPARVPRVAKLMALAIRFDKLVRDGDVVDYAELARLGHVTRARLTQIMNLLALAPDIQEALLFLAPVEAGKDAVTKRELRPLVAKVGWIEQRLAWNTLQKQLQKSGQLGTGSSLT